MTEPTRWQKIKKWVHDNPETVIYTAVGSAVTVAYAYLVVLASKEQEQAIKEYNERAGEFNTWLNETQNSGKAVYQLHDNRYLVLPLDAQREIVIK